MLNWDNASKATKVTMSIALICFALGLLLAVIGVSSKIQPLMFTAIGLLAVGVVSHLVGFGLRMADGRRAMRQAQRGAGVTARKGKK